MDCVAGESGAHFSLMVSFSCRVVVLHKIKSYSSFTHAATILPGRRQGDVCDHHDGRESDVCILFGDASSFHIIVS